MGTLSTPPLTSCQQHVQLLELAHLWEEAPCNGAGCFPCSLPPCAAYPEGPLPAAATGRVCELWGGVGVEGGMEGFCLSPFSLYTSHPAQLSSAPPLPLWPWARATCSCQARSHAPAQLLFPYPLLGASKCCSRNARRSCWSPAKPSRSGGWSSGSSCLAWKLCVLTGALLRRRVGAEQLGYNLTCGHLWAQMQ